MSVYCRPKMPQMPAIVYHPIFLVNAQSMAIKDKRRIPPPPKNSIMFSSRYKTEICRQYEELGHCEYGERCLFAHGSYELRELPNRHPKHKTQVCSSYDEQGFCTFGPRCSFIHRKPNTDAIILEMQHKSKPMPMPENQNRNICIGDGDCHTSSSKDLDKAVHEVDIEQILKFFREDGNKRLPFFEQITNQEDH